MWHDYYSCTGVTCYPVGNEIFIPSRMYLVTIVLLVYSDIMCIAVLQLVACHQYHPPPLWPLNQIID